MRVFVMKLSYNEEVILQSGVAAYPDARTLGLAPYHCELMLASTIMLPEVAIDTEKAFVDKFSQSKINPMELENSTWNFYSYSDTLLHEMTEELLGEEAWKVPPQDKAVDDIVE